MSLKNEWQRTWREALGEPTDSMPDVREDFTLHFDIWNLSDDKLEECFSIFPSGFQLLSRVNELRKTPPKTIEVKDETLLTMLDQLNSDIETVLLAFEDDGLIDLNSEKSLASERSVYRGNESLRQKVFSTADSPTIYLDDDLCELIKKHCGEEGYETFHFLSEPLYQLSGCHYPVSHWVIWALVENQYEADPYKLAFELYKMKAQAGWAANRQFVFIES